MIKLQSEEDILQVIKHEEWMMNILHTAASLELLDWWVCAGFVRSKIWDTLHEFSERTPLDDIDVIYFNPKKTHEQEEKKLEIQLQQLNSAVPWSVKNQARMHQVNDVSPYISSTDGIYKFPETPTALGVKLDSQGNLVLASPRK